MVTAYPGAAKSRSNLSSYLYPTTLFRRAENGLPAFYCFDVSSVFPFFKELFMQKVKIKTQRKLFRFPLRFFKIDHT
ncbi:MAG: hypothetical protein Q4A39_01120 [Eubacteriales bacterium]|nr:hypothetical protein [Eubacteriales bacterium]